MGDVSNPSQRDSGRELIGEGRQVLLEAADDEGVHIIGELFVKQLVQLVGELSVVVWAEVRAILGAFDLMRVDEV